MKEIPILFTEKEECCGCTACEAVCSMNAISMQPDKEGFLYPIVDETKCICCYRCLKVCSFKDNK